MTGGAPVRPGAALGEVLDALGARGLPRAEVYAKRGRSRVVEETPAGVAVSYHREEGWAARAGDDRRSLFAAGTGAPSPEGPGGGWPEADGEALELPASAPPVEDLPWRDPPDLDAPLAGEREAMALVATLREELAAELPEARMLRVRLADGASEWEVASRPGEGAGVAATGRGRAALLRIEAALPGGSAASDGPPRRPATAALEVAAREARSFEPRALARRIADRLTVAATGSAPERDRAPLLLAPPVVARLLAGLLPLFLGGRGAELARRLEDRDGRLGSPSVQVVDDGRLPGGILAASHDGEGVPTGAVCLVEAGLYRRPLLSWRESGRPSRGASRSPGRRTGCVRRPGWRDLPRIGPSHLFLAPENAVSVGELLGDVARGYYLIDLDGTPVLDLAEGRLVLPAVGFTVERGRATAPLAGALVDGGIGTLLRGVEAVARDLTFFPLAGGMIGAPTLLATGLEIRSR